MNAPAPQVTPIASAPCWVDTHCHLDAPEFDADRDEVIARAKSVGVLTQVVPAVMPSTCETAREAAHRCAGWSRGHFCAVGRRLPLMLGPTSP